MPNKNSRDKVQQMKSFSPHFCINIQAEGRDKQLEKCNILLIKCNAPDNALKASLKLPSQLPVGTRVKAFLLWVLLWAYFSTRDAQANESHPFSLACNTEGKWAENTADQPELTQLLSIFKPIFTSRKLNPFTGFMRNFTTEPWVLLTIYMYLALWTRARCAKSYSYI